MTSDRQRLIDLIVTNLHFLVRLEMTRDEALEFKKIILHPIGLLNGKYNLFSEAKAKKIIYENRRDSKILIDSSG